MFFRSFFCPLCMIICFLFHIKQKYMLNMKHNVVFYCCWGKPTNVDKPTKNVDDASHLEDSVPLGQGALYINRADVQLGQGALLINSARVPLAHILEFPQIRCYKGICLRKSYDKQKSFLLMP